MKMMRRAPLVLRVTSASAAFTVRNAPVRFTSIMLCQRERSVFSAGALAAAPAVGTTISIGPYALRAALAMETQSSSFVTSAAIAVAFPKLAATSFHRPFRLPPNQKTPTPPARPLPRKRARDRCTYTGAAAGDQSMPVVEHTHQTFPVIASIRDLRR